MIMANIELLEVVLEGGIRNTNFFNGRLLSAEDLKAEQAANRRQHQHLGRVMGTGVVSGLSVSMIPGPSTKTRTSVSITAGQAINRKGQVLHLPDGATLALVRESEKPESGAGIFTLCEPPQKTTVPTGTGVYVLLIAPASGFRERALMSGLDDEGVARQCGSKYSVEGVRFRLEKLDLASPALFNNEMLEELSYLQDRKDEPGMSMLRNLLAYVCLGFAGKAAVPGDLAYKLRQAGSDAEPGPIGVLREAGCITDCDVPLALICWAKEGVRFADMWSVRRRVHRLPDSALQPFPVTDRTLAEGEALYLQFQDHISDLVGRLPHGQLAYARALDYFLHLPPVGVLPEHAQGSLGFDIKVFFEDLTLRNPPTAKGKQRDLLHIEGAKVNQLIGTSFLYKPIDLAGHELIWLYRVRENRQAVDPKSIGTKPYVVFSTGHMPYQAEARFDAAYWDYANYALRVAW
jgi:hypothetical protein